MAEIEPNGWATIRMSKALRGQENAWTYREHTVKVRITAKRLTEVNGVFVYDRETGRDVSARYGGGRDWRVMLYWFNDQPPVIIGTERKNEIPRVSA